MGLVVLERLYMQPKIQDIDEQVHDNDPMN